MQVIQHIRNFMSSSSRDPLDEQLQRIIVKADAQIKEADKILKALTDIRRDALAMKCTIDWFRTTKNSLNSTITKAQERNFDSRWLNLVEEFNSSCTMFADGIHDIEDGFTTRVGRLWDLDDLKHSPLDAFARKLEEALFSNVDLPVLAKQITATANEITVAANSKKHSVEDSAYDMPPGRALRSAGPVDTSSVLVRVAGIAKEQSSEAKEHTEVIEIDGSEDEAHDAREAAPKRRRTDDPPSGCARASGGRLLKKTDSSLSAYPDPHESPLLCSQMSEGRGDDPPLASAATERRESGSSSSTASAKKPQRVLQDEENSSCASPLRTETLVLFSDQSSIAAPSRHAENEPVGSGLAAAAETARSGGLDGEHSTIDLT